MSLPSLAAFLEAVSADDALQAQVLAAPDAASLAAIAQAAGFAVSEADWLTASEASRPEIAAPPWQALAADPWAEEPVDPLAAFLQQAQADPALQEALVKAADAAAVADLAQQAGYPLTSADLWAASEAVPEELERDAPTTEAPTSQDEATQNQATQDEATLNETVLQTFLRQLEGDAELQQTLAEAADAAAVARLAQAAGHPLREVDLWRASGLEPQHLSAPPPPRHSPGEAALLAFLHQAQADALLLEALAEAADAAAVAAIAQGAGYPISPADLWAASGAEPEELVVPLLVIEV